MPPQRSQLKTPVEDLQASGLNSESIKRMNIRLAPGALLSKVEGASGYIIPYFTTGGLELPSPAYRIKLLSGFLKTPSGKPVKYLQPKGSECHAYLPPIIDPSEWLDPCRRLIITEGEKKAVKSCQEGLLTLGLGGVDSWRSRHFALDVEDLQEAEDGKIKFKAHGSIELLEERVVPEFLELPWDDREVIIVFDSDSDSGAAVSSDVQRAAFDLAIWLQDAGAFVTQVRLPLASKNKDNAGPVVKVGLDDYLLNHSACDFLRLERLPVQHPNVRQWLKRSMDNKRLRRSDVTKQAFAIINSLDSQGKRFVDNVGNYYYFHSKSAVLHSFRWEKSDQQQLCLSTFGQLLHSLFAVNSADAPLIQRVAAEFTRGAHLVKPHAVSHCTSNALYVQLSDSEVALVRAGSINIVPNGTDDVLFLSGQVEPIDTTLLTSRLANCVSCATKRGEAQGQWKSILKSVNLQPLKRMSLEETQLLISCLFYLSPLFRRWRGLMLPVELIISEPNSGKTFLYNLRKAILTGKPSLSNSPLTQKDWYSQLIHAPAMWVCDNMGEIDKGLRTALSDELARLITDPDPRIEMRRYYTATSKDDWPIDCTFAITAIRNPFWKPDLLQRALIINMKAIPKGQRQSDWYTSKLEDGGRVNLLLDHLLVAERFLSVCTDKWAAGFLSSHRLVNYEQALLRMAEALGEGPMMTSVIPKLFEAVSDQIVENDPVLSGLLAFVNEVLKQGEKAPKHVKASDIVKWVQVDKESRFDHIHALQNPILLGRYISQHAYDVQEAVGLYAIARGNSTVYCLKETLDIDV